ncbi:tRNA guanosine(15) transglycosylase TgtA [Sulfolobales archaeon HS-7]|nr:tRNA guanosine(15) transglycosylase TgtA [Sulfolobales archaeon HS-7]
MNGDFEIKYEDLAGRIGVLHTRHGKLETPAFFPVIDPSDTTITPKDLKSLGFDNFITNAYFLKKMQISSTIHSFFNTDQIIMTDSGAYQILEYGNVDVTNKEIVEYENLILPDIGVILDIPTGNSNKVEKVKYSVEETIKRGKEVESVIDNERIVWLHPIQGGYNLELLSFSAKMADSANKYKMLGLGSPTVLMKEYNYVKLVEMIYTAKSNVSRGKALHLFGAGLPHVFPIAVILGVDTFDSASYILYARNGRYITEGRVYKLDQLDYFPCSCNVCSRYLPKELKEMEYQDRTRLLSIHNLIKISEEIKRIKIAIREGRLFEYAEEKSLVHPSLYDSFNRLKKYKEYLENYDRRTGEKGIFLITRNSLWRPEITRHKTFMKNYKVEKNSIILIDGLKIRKPFISSEFVRNIREKFPEAEVLIFYPYFGLIPINVSEIYPLSQFENSKSLEYEVKRDLLKTLAEFCKSNDSKQITIYASAKLAKKIERICKAELHYI